MTSNIVSKVKLLPVQKYRVVIFISIIYIYKCSSPPGVRGRPWRVELVPLVAVGDRDHPPARRRLALLQREQLLQHGELAGSVPRG